MWLPPSDARKGIALFLVVLAVTIFALVVLISIQTLELLKYFQIPE
ncbi:MAG: hypothetical protein HYS55_04260 [Candidatus Omnitrophica bacterium]|nr:hypothetical protein [Candidatus Omnitrophota bacterium]